MADLLKGNAQIRLRDQVSWFVSGRKLPALGLAAGALTAAFILAGDLLIKGTLTTQSLLGAGLAFAAVPVLAGAALFVLSVAAFLRLSPAQKTMTWEISADGVRTCDGAGASLFIPWTQVRGIVRRGNGLAVLLRPAGARWIPARAFNADEIDCLMEIAENSGKKEEAASIA